MRIAAINITPAVAVLAILAILASASHTCGQSHPVEGKQPRDSMPLLRTPATVSPWQTFQHLRQGNANLIQVSPNGRAAKRPRPFGLGRRIAAVMVPTGLRKSAATLFSVHHHDLLVFSSTGPTAGADDVARLEHAVDKEQVSLLVILVNPKDPMFVERTPFDTPAGRRLRAHLNDANGLAHRNGLSVPIAHGILQTDAVWLRSRLLEQKRLHGHFQIALGLVNDKNGAIEWVTKWHKRWRLLSSASAAELIKLRRREMATSRARAAAAKAHRKKARAKKATKHTH